MPADGTTAPFVCCRQLDLASLQVQSAQTTRLGCRTHDLAIHFVSIRPCSLAPRNCLQSVCRQDLAPRNDFGRQLSRVVIGVLSSEACSRARSGGPTWMTNAASPQDLSLHCHAFALFKLPSWRPVAQAFTPTCCAIPPGTPGRVDTIASCASGRLLTTLLGCKSQEQP